MARAACGSPTGSRSTAKLADELCVIRSCVSDGINHAGGVCQMNTGVGLRRASLARVLGQLRTRHGQRQIFPPSSCSRTATAHGR